MQNILEQLLKWRFGQKREKIDERQLFLFAVQMEATGEDVKELVAELEQDQESKPDDDNDPAATATADQSAKPRGHLCNRLPRTLTRKPVAVVQDRELEMEVAILHGARRRLTEATAGDGWSAAGTSAAPKWKARAANSTNHGRVRRGRGHQKTGSWQLLVFRIADVKQASARSFLRFVRRRSPARGRERSGRSG